MKLKTAVEREKAVQAMIGQTFVIQLLFLGGITRLFAVIPVKTGITATNSEEGRVRREKRGVQSVKKEEASLALPCPPLFLLPSPF